MSRKPERAALLAETAGLYRRCLELTRKALAPDPAPGEQKLADLLRRRAVMFERIGDLEKVLESGFPRGAWAKGPGVPSEVKVLVEEIQGLLASLLEADRRLGERLAGELAATGGEIRRLKKGHSALKGYAPFHGGRAFLVDRRG
ncbi:MAG: hypothetical protein AB1896_04695 [Thermodesulfobacteriota bacterium]